MPLIVHGIRAGGVEIDDCMAAAIDDMLLELPQAVGMCQHMLRGGVDLTNTPTRSMFDFIQERTVFRMNDVVFTPRAAPCAARA